MKAPKLTWEGYKDANGNWLKRMTPREVITAQAERIAALEAERDAWKELAEAQTAWEIAVRRSERDVALGRIGVALKRLNDMSGSQK